MRKRKKKNKKQNSNAETFPRKRLAMQKKTNAKKTKHAKHEDDFGLPGRDSP